MLSQLPVSMGREELNLFVGCYAKASGFYSHFVRVVGY